MRQNATTGAPVRSEPKLGKACREPAVPEGSHREDLRGCHHTLAPSTVDPDLEHPDTRPAALYGRGAAPTRAANSANRLA